MKYIITESQHTRLEILTLMTKKELASYLSELYPLRYPCEYKNIELFLWAVRYEMENTLSTDTILSLPQDMVWEEVSNMFGEQMTKFYLKACDNEEGNVPTKFTEYI